MKPQTRQDRARLLTMAKAIANALRTKSDGTRLRIRIPNKINAPATDGWRAGIGNLGKNQPRLQIWLDTFAGYPDRRFSACFYSYERKAIIAITKKVKKKLWPVRVITNDDTEAKKFFTLNKRLAQIEFNAPILEKYSGSETIFGIYDRSKAVSKGEGSLFCARAVAFFEDVARSMPGAKEVDSEREVFPRCEDRKWVQSHLRRDRSGYLAAQCKERDGYECKVCGMSFAKVYGDKLGATFAEAHHLTPLGQQKDKVRTNLGDLITVCANCHRMLHKMDGKKGDLAKLRAIVRKHKK